MINQSALANAVINITGNTRGLEQAIGETKKQMHGFMVFAQAMGGKTGGFLANMLAMGGASPVLNSVLGDRIGGAASLFLKRAGVMSDPMFNIYKAQERAEAQYKREVYQHKMAGAALRVGGMYKGSRINDQIDLKAARIKHSMSAPNKADIFQEHLSKAAQEAQELAMLFGKYGAVVRLAIPYFTKMVSYAAELDQRIRQFNQTFKQHTGASMSGYGGLGSPMSMSQYMAGTAGIGQELRQNGIGGSMNASMSAALSQRAGAMAGSFGESYEDVAKSMEAAVGGSDGAMKRFGVILSDDLVRAQAFNSGLLKIGETMTEDVAAQARYKLILSQTKDSVEGGVASFFNLRTQWDTLMSNFTTGLSHLGAAFIPAISGVLGLTNALIKIAASPIGIAYRYGGHLEEKLAEIEKAREAGKPEEDSLERASVDAKRAADVIRRERARQSSNVGYHSPEEFYNHIQKGIFGNRDELLKRQADLMHKFLLVSEEQLRIMKEYGYKVKSGAPLLEH